ncbi:MAG: hypothetical protein JWO19_5726 [Bryobacterales bacterium]|nr:hypothetical protein [Bryobacterales bacterium]
MTLVIAGIMVFAVGMIIGLLIGCLIGFGASQ